MDFLFVFIVNNWISVVGAIIGLIYIYLEYKANVWMWAASILMAFFYIYIFYKTSLYASMIIYIYFFLASIYGWIVWIFQNRDKETGQEIITNISHRYVLPIIVCVVFISVLISIFLIQFSNNPYHITIGDATTTSLNIIALWMISRKWAQQWLLVIPANFISSILLFLQQDVMSGCLFLAYFIISIFGYINWRKMTISN